MIVGYLPLSVVLLLGIVVVNADVNLSPPTQCYSNCLSSILAKVGCSFSDLNCYCGVSNTNFTGQLTGCVLVNCDSQDQASGASFLAGACAVLTSGQTTLPASLATIIPAATTSSSNGTASATISMSITSTSSLPSLTPSTGFRTITTTDSSGTYATTVPIVSEVSTSKSDGTSTGALIGGIVGGIVGFLILALLFMSVVLYILVRRSVERRQQKNAAYLHESKHSPSHSRSSVAASDTPEDDLKEMEPSFWGVVTRPKQALRVVNG